MYNLIGKNSNFASLLTDSSDVDNVDSDPLSDFEVLPLHIARVSNLYD
jgi:hypothetical protein